jgi:hypothetical protein
MMYEGISEEEREEAAERCDADMVVAVIENEFLNLTSSSLAGDPDRGQGPTF